MSTNLKNVLITVKEINSTLKVRYDHERLQVLEKNENKDSDILLSKQDIKKILEIISTTDNSKCEINDFITVDYNCESGLKIEELFYNDEDVQEIIDSILVPYTYLEDFRAILKGWN